SILPRFMRVLGPSTGQESIVSNDDIRRHQMQFPRPASTASVTKSFICQTCNQVLKTNSELKWVPVIFAISSPYSDQERLGNTKLATTNPSGAIFRAAHGRRGSVPATTSIDTKNVSTRLGPKPTPSTGALSAKAKTKIGPAQTILRHT